MLHHPPTHCITHALAVHKVLQTGWTIRSPELYLRIPVCCVCIQRLHTLSGSLKRFRAATSRLNLDGVTSASALAAWQRLRTQQWAVIDGAVGEAAAAQMRREILGLWKVGCRMQRHNGGLLSATPSALFGLQRLMQVSTGLGF